MQGHEPVLVNQVLSYLQVEPGGRYLDGTLGLGGHTLAILRACSEPVRVLGLDRDAQSLEEARMRIQAAGLSERVELVQAEFSDFSRVMEQLGWRDLHGALLDLGISSWQLERQERGFSLYFDGPLDMRLDQDFPGETAHELVNRANERRLQRIIWDLGEEPLAGRIARRILKTRSRGPIQTTSELAKVVEGAYPPKRRRKAKNHPATRTFQALRIAVNSELEELSQFLERIPYFLRPGARVAVISFHSLEDRLVKQSFRRAARGCECPQDQLMCTCSGAPRLELVNKKPVTPDSEEISRNRRSRSAKLRVARAPQG